MLKHYYLPLKLSLSLVGVNAEAAGYLAQVKARANMEGKTVAAITADLQKLGKQAFIEECWTERLREFPLENEDLG